jgi:hypothetical protein
MSPAGRSHWAAEEAREATTSRWFIMGSVLKF